MVSNINQNTILNLDTKEKQRVATVFLLSTLTTKAPGKLGFPVHGISNQAPVFYLKQQTLCGFI